jgi:hypothetical protein
MRLSRLYWLAFIALYQLGCPGSLDPALFALNSTSTQIFDCIVYTENLFANRCVTFCHEPGGNYSQVLLKGEGYGQALLDKPTTQVKCDASLLQINTENPEQSLLLLKVDETPPCGETMPIRGGLRLSALEKECLLQWLNDVISPPEAPGTSTTTSGSP